MLIRQLVVQHLICFIFRTRVLFYNGFWKTYISLPAAHPVPPASWSSPRQMVVSRLMRTEDEQQKDQQDTQQKKSMYLCREYSVFMGMAKSIAWKILYKSNSFIYSQLHTEKNYSLLPFHSVCLNLICFIFLFLATGVEPCMQSYFVVVPPTSRFEKLCILKCFSARHSCKE